MPDGYKRGVPELSYWMQQIRKGIEYRKKVAYEASWPRWRQYYRGEWKDGVLPTNIFFKMLRSTVPKIYFQNPGISVKASKPGIESAILASLLQRVDNKLLRTMKMKRQMKRMVQDAWMFGTGIGKKGFGSLYNTTPEPFSTGAAPIKQGKLIETVEYNFDVKENMPWFMRASPGMFVVPAELSYIEDARWTCFIIRRPISDLKTDDRFKNVADLTGTSTNFSTDQDMTWKVPVPMIDLYEIRDKKTGKVFVLSAGVDKPLLYEDDELSRLGINAASTLVFNDDDERFWGIPDSQILEPLQLEANEIRTYTMYHRRMSLVKLLVKRNGMNEDEAVKLVNGDVAPVIWTEGDPRTTVNPLTVSGIPVGLIESGQLVDQDVRESLGFGRNQFGEYRQGSRSPTAAEVGVVQQASEIRVDERRDIVADMLIDVVEDFHPIIFDHWDQDLVEQIVGPAGIPFWIKFQPQMLSKVSYEITADPDQSVPESREGREQKAMVVYKTLATNPLIDPFKLTQYLLRELHGVQFDDMIRGLPPGAGMSPENPLTVPQYGQVLQQVGQRAPQALPPGTGQ